MLANSSMKDYFHLQMNELMNLSPPKFLKKAAKISPLTFSMEHLLHRLCGVDAPVNCSQPA